VSSTPAIEHHVALPRYEGVVGRSGALADTTAGGRLAALGATAHLVDMRRNPLHPANAAAVTAVRQVISQVQPDVVHGHSSVGGAVARVSARWMEVPCVYTPNGLMTSLPAVGFERGLGRMTARFVAVSATEAERVIALKLVPAGRVVVIPNGIDLAATTPAGAARAGEVDVDVRKRLGLPAGTPLVATVARVAAQKAPEQFVRACAAVARRRPGVHFLLVGLGPRQRRVDREVALGGLGGRFHQIPHLENAAAVMAQFDVLALLSRYEGGPYVPLEAMRAGVPVVLSDVVGNHDTVDDGATGFLVPFGDAEAAASAIVKLLDDETGRAAIVAGATARLQRDFDVRVMGERLTALYSELASGEAARPAVSGRRRSTRRLPHPSSGQSVKRPDPTASQYSSYGGRPPWAGSGKTSWMASRPPGATFGDQPR
jgi:glycosyltransferase involved in cell wall biosynthesis